MCRNLIKVVSISLCSDDVNDLVKWRIRMVLLVLLNVLAKNAIIADFTEAKLG